MKPWRVVFRADASLRMGTGHVMRCLTLADTLRERGARCHFICREHPGHLIDLVRARGHAVSGLPAPSGPAAEGVAGDPPHAAWLGVTQAQDAEQTLAQLPPEPLDWLVVDHYALDARWERVLRPRARRLLAIDDLADRPHDVDLLLDQNLGRDATHYGALLGPGTRCLVGPGFGLLRPEFAQARAASLARRAAVPTPRHLLVAMGGADADNTTGRVLQALAHATLDANARLTVVMGPTAPWLEAVRAQAGAMPWPTQVRAGVSDMAALMADADLAVGAAGTTAWERCCLGLPTIAWVLADNQRESAAALAAAGAVACLPVPPALPHDLLAALDRLRAPGRLRAMQHACAAITDGLGAARVRSAMEDQLAA